MRYNTQIQERTFQREDLVRRKSGDARDFK